VAKYDGEAYSNRAALPSRRATDCQEVSRALT
jgi:hypothetical protein